MKVSFLQFTEFLHTYNEGGFPGKSFSQAFVLRFGLLPTPEVTKLLRIEFPMDAAKYVEEVFVHG